MKTSSSTTSLIRDIWSCECFVTSFKCILLFILDIWAGIVPRMGLKRNMYSSLVGKNLKKRGNLEYLGTDVSMILKCIFKK
jgi:hypothetical protein